MNTIGNYEIIREIGQGAMGIVYLGRDRNTGLEVAVKILQKATEEGQQRFLREARIAARFNHPGLVKIYDFGLENSQPYMAMQYLTGEDLKDLLARRGPLPVSRALKLAIQIARALHYAHEAKVVHRDLKPANIVFEKGRPVITDFGVATLEDSMTITRTGQWLGSPAYMAPEQMTDSEKVSPRSDIYSLGVIFYEMVTGELPLKSGNRYEMVYKAVSVEPTPPSEVNPDLPPFIDAVCLRAMAKEPSHRYESALKMARVLESLGEVEVPPSPQRASGEETRYQPAATSVQLTQRRSSPSPKKTRSHERRSPSRHSWKKTLIFWAFLAVFAGVGVFYYYGQKGGEKEGKEESTLKDKFREGQRVRALLRPLEKGASEREIERRVGKIVTSSTGHTLPFLMEALSHQSRAVRRAAIRALGKLGSEKSRYEGRLCSQWLWERFRKLNLEKDRREIEEILSTLSQFQLPEAEFFKDLPRHWKELEEYYQRGEWEKAEAMVKEILLKTPFWPEMSLRQGWIWAFDRKYSQAKKRRKDLAKILSKDPHYRTFCAYLDLQTFRKPRAFEILKKVKDSNFTSPEYCLVWSIYTQKVLVDEKKAYQWIIRGLNQSPQWWPLLIRRLQLFLERKKYHRCREESTQLLKDFPHRPRIYRIRGNAHRALRSEAQFVRDYEKALHLISRQLEEKPRSYRLLYFRLNLCHRLERFDKMIDSGRSLAKRGIHRDLAYYSMGLGYMEKKKLAPAIDYFLKARKITEEKFRRHPRYYSLHQKVLYYLGRSYYTSAQFDEAIPLFEKLIEFNPRAKAARFWLGMMALKRNKEDRAIKIFKEILEDFPQYVQVASHLADLYYQAGRYREFLSLTTDATRRFHHAFNAYKMEVKGLFYEKKYAEIVKLCTLGIERFPRQYILYYYRGLAHRARGEKEKALSDFLIVKGQSQVRELKKRSRKLLKELREGK